MSRLDAAVRSRLALAMVLLTAFTVRLLHVLSYESEPTNDMAVYVDMAVRRLSLGNLFTMEGMCWFPPGYSFFLKPFFLLADPAAALAAVKIAQAAIGAGTCWLVYRLARRLHSRLAGLAASLMTAFFPHFLFYTSAFMSETLFIALFYAGLLTLLRACHRPAAGTLYSAGLLCAAAVLVRPVGVALAPAAAAAAWRAAPDRRGRLRAAASIVTGALTLVAPWAARNAIAYGHVVVIAPNGPFNLAAGNHPDATGRYTTPPSIDGDLWERMDDFRSRALEFVVEDPLGALYVVMRLKWDAFWEMIPPWPLYSSNPSLFAGDLFFPWVSWRLVLAAGTLGLGMLAQRRRPMWWLTPAVLAAYVAVYMGYFGNARFRMPAEGLFLAWAGVAAAVAFRAPARLRRLRTGQWNAAVCMLLALVLAQAGLKGASTRAALHDRGTILAVGSQFPIVPGRGDISIFGDSPIPVDRRRGRFLRLSMQIYRMGPARDTPDNGQVKLDFLDSEGRRRRWFESPTLFLEALPADRWVPVTLRAHVPPSARSLRAWLAPASGSPDTVIVDQPILRYSPGNDPALEGIFPYLRYYE